MSDFPRRVLYSPGYGAGWSSRVSDEFAQQVAEYTPIITYIDNGGDPAALSNDRHPLIVQMISELGMENEGFYPGGARDLRVVSVYGPYRIDEYDGNEDVIEQSRQDFWR